MSRVTHRAPPPRGQPTPAPTHGEQEEDGDRDDIDIPTGEQDDQLQ